MKISFAKTNALCLALAALTVLPRAYPAVFSGEGAGIHHSHETGGYLGVNFENLTPQQREKLQMPGKAGVAIAAVDHDAPAGKAGLKPKDVILALNGKKMKDADDLRAALHKLPPGTAITLKVLHDGHTTDVPVVLADRKTIEQEAWSQHYTVPDPADQRAADPDSPPDPHPATLAAGNPQPPAQPQQSSGFFSSMPSEIGKTFSSNGGLMSYIPGTPPYTGLDLELLNPQLAAYFGLRNKTGLLVKSVDAGSPGAHAGLKAGDVLCAANDTAMTSRSRWNHILRENRHDAIRISILRHGQHRTLVMTLSASKS
jgi:serine protease Do